MDDKINAKLAVLLGVLAVSTAALLVRLSQAPAVAVAANRLMITLILLGPVAVWRCGPEILATPKRDRMVAALAGLFLGFHFLMWFSSLRLTGVAASVVLVSTHPLFILAYTRFFDRQTIGPARLTGTLCALLGIVLIALSDWQGATGHALLGDILALGGAVTAAGYFLLGREARKTMSNLNYVAHAYLVAWLVLAVSAAFGGVPLISYPPREWLIFTALALLPTILGHTVFNWALARVEVSFVSVMILGEPVCASLLAYLFLHEIPTFTHLIGGLFVLTGLFVFVRSDHRPQQND